MDLCKEKQSNISTCYFKTLKLGGLTAKEISKRSRVTEANISKFKNGGDIYSSSYERLVNALPLELKRQYYLLLLESESLKKGEKQSELNLANQIETLAYQLRNNRLSREK